MGKEGGGDVFWFYLVDDKTSKFIVNFAALLKNSGFILGGQGVLSRVELSLIWVVPPLQGFVYAPPNGRSSPLERKS